MGSCYHNHYVHFSTDYIELSIGLRNEVTGLHEFDVLTPSGPCENMPGRYELPYRLTPRIPSNDNPPILLPASRSAALNLEPPYCIAFTTTLPSRGLGTLFAAMDPAFIGPIVTSLRIRSNVVKFTSGGQEVSFFPPDGAASFVQSPNEYIHLQLCVTDNQAQLYINCDPQPLTESFSSEQRLDTALMTFFQNDTLNGGDFFSVCQLSCNTTHFVFLHEHGPPLFYLHAWGPHSDMEN